MEVLQWKSSAAAHLFGNAKMKGNVDGAKTLYQTFSFFRFHLDFPQ